MNIGESYPYCMSLTLITDYSIIDIDRIDYDILDNKYSIPLSLYLITNNKATYEYYQWYWQRSIISLNSSETIEFRYMQSEYTTR